jgi:hypothetical protein
MNGSPRTLTALAGFSALWAVVAPAAAQPTPAVRGGRTDAPLASRHWAFLPIRQPPLPASQAATWAGTPVDVFVRAKLDEAGLEPAPPADRRTRLRRIYLDLIGLPPTPDEQRQFLADESPDAVARVVDDLLARPQYGERWARHWLDVTRYAESNGYERDGVKPHAWRYRDYVIDSFNRDKPFDRFLTEQIAGDEIDDSNAESQIATTFLRLGTWDDEPADPDVDRYDQLDDVLGTTATAFLGITLRCARCHDHKFEPFSQADYYRMLAVFQPLKRPQNNRADLDRHVGTAAVLDAYRTATAQADAQVATIQQQIDRLKQTTRDRLFAGVSADGAAAAVRRTSLPADVVAAFQADPAKRTDAQKELVKKHADKLDQEIRDAATCDERACRADWERQLEAVNATRPPEPPRAYIWYEEGAVAPATHILRRGDPAGRTIEVTPGTPPVLGPQPAAPPQPRPHSTGRRLWLARWLTSPQNPLVARVVVNRIWQHHFGEGLVASENDFGTMGDRPSHPELLDWLAAEFIAGGWHIKPLHRQIVLSQTYQQAVAPAAHLPGRASRAGRAVDPDNRLLWHWPQRRLEAETLRDAVMAASGRLNLQMAGPSIYPAVPRAVLEGQSRPGEGWGKSDEHQAARRSVYIFVKRVLAVPELELLDAPDTTSSCEQRPVSTIAPQALTFLNGEFMHEQSRHFAARLLREAGPDPADQVRLAFEWTVCRPPRPEELQAAIAFLSTQQRQVEADARKARTAADPRRQALQAFCLVLLNTNEFAYVD